MAAELLESGPIIDDYLNGAREGLEELARHDVGARVTAIAIIPEGGHKPIESYLRQLRVHSSVLEDHGLVYQERRCSSPAEAIDAAREQYPYPGGEIFMAPWPNDPEGRRLQAALGHLAGIRDIDGMTESGRRNWHFPATPLSVDSLADLGTGGLQTVDPARIATVGNGLTVMQPYKQLLERRGIKPGIEIDRDNSKELLPRLHEMADVVITATGVAGLIKPEYLIRKPSEADRPMVVVDAGVGVYRNRDNSEDPENGNVYGDVHPSTYDYDGDQLILVTPAPVEVDGERRFYGGGVGPGTVARLVHNGVQAARYAVDLSLTAA